MLILKPYPHVTIWGGERLAKYIGQNISNIGHLYTVRGNREDSNEILNYNGKEKTLYEYFCVNKSKWGMDEYEEFPLSIALVDAKSNLSVQVHPSREIAAQYETVAVGKNESFYILEEPEIGKMINGCKCKSKEELVERVANEQWEDIIDYLPVHEGNYVYVPAGTMHAMTKGALTYEIEENCNYTYRLYDYDRVDAQGKKRELDVEKAISSIAVAQKSYVQQYTEEEIVEEKYATRLLVNINQYENTTSNIVCLTIIDGMGCLDGIKISSGMSIVLEAGEVVNELEIKKAIVARIL